jgi:NACHT domain
VYFQYDARSLHTSESVLRALCSQIVHQLGDVPQSLQTAYDRLKGGGMSGQPDKTFYLSLLTECIEKFSTVFFIFDAFDECMEDQRSDVLKWLQQLLRSQLRVLLTARPHVSESPEFCEDGGLQEWIQPENTLEISASTDDIASYLEQKLNSNKRCDDEVKKTILDTISVNAQGQ